MALKTGWVGEENGVSKWPSIFYNDIANYLKILGPDFINKLDRKFKLGKAYSYFADNFVREIYYHNISEKSKYCILKCRVVPSQKVSSKPYHVWAVFVKNVESDFPVGTIKTAYCICTAGLCCSCNHITVFSFRVESFVVIRKSKPSQTSQLCTWNVPTGTKVDITPLSAQEMMFQNQHYARLNERDLQKDKESHWSFLRLYTRHKKQL